MTEETLIKLTNSLNKKRIEFYEIVNKTNNGELRENFIETQIFDEDVDYNVSLIAFNGSSLFPNIFKGKNDTFYYSGPDNLNKTIVFEEGSYEIEHINQTIKKVIPNGITIELDKANGKSIIQLLQDYKVYFDKEKTFKKILGYDGSTSILRQDLNYSPKICDVVDITTIYVYVDIIKGRWYHGKTSKILFSFPNDVEFGRPISIIVNPLQSQSLIYKKFDAMNFSFKDQNGNPIDFMGSDVTLTLSISQV